jgi:hypothetical protein
MYRMREYQAHLLHLMRPLGNVRLVNAQGVYPKPPELFLPSAPEKLEKISPDTMPLAVDKYGVALVGSAPDIRKASVVAFDGGIAHFALDVAFVTIPGISG